MAKDKKKKKSKPKNSTDPQELKVSSPNSRTKVTQPI
jgi:hypothetical protein